MPTTNNQGDEKNSHVRRSKEPSEYGGYGTFDQLMVCQTLKVHSPPNYRQRTSTKHIFHDYSEAFFQAK